MISFSFKLLTKSKCQVILVVKYIFEISVFYLFGFEDRNLVLIVPDPGDCLYFTFETLSFEHFNVL